MAINGRIATILVLALTCALALAQAQGQAGFPYGKELQFGTATVKVYRVDFNLLGLGRFTPTPYYFITDIWTADPATTVFRAVFTLSDGTTRTHLVDRRPNDGTMDFSGPHPARGAIITFALRDDIHVVGLTVSQHVQTEVHSLKPE